MIVIATLPIIGGLLSAWHGGQISGGDNKALKNVLWMLPFLICSLIVNPFSWHQIFNTANVAKGVGHGRGFRLKEPMKVGSTPERVEMLIFWLEGKIPLYWYKVLIMALTGLAAVIGSVIAFGFYDPMAGLSIAIGGLFKGVNAMLFDQDTKVREYADGTAAYSGLVGAIIIILTSGN